MTQSRKLITANQKHQIILQVAHKIVILETIDKEKEITYTSLINKLHNMNNIVYTMSLLVKDNLVNSSGVSTKRKLVKPLSNILLLEVLPHVSLDTVMQLTQTPYLQNNITRMDLLCDIIISKLRTFNTSCTISSILKELNKND